MVDQGTNTRDVGDQARDPVVAQYTAESFFAGNDLLGLPAQLVDLSPQAMVVHLRGWFAVDSIDSAAWTEVLQQRLVGSASTGQVGDAMSTSDKESP